MKKILQAVGPALIVAAVVLGPGSILTSSKVGASLGLIGFPVVVGAAVLMIAMVALSARLGAFYERSLCNELAGRLGRPVAVAIGLIIFTLVAIYQSSNNIALVAGIEPMLGEGEMSFAARVSVLVGVNVLVICSLYFLRDLYRFIETGMKVLIGLMTIAFLVNFTVVFLRPRGYEPQVVAGEFEWLPLLGMIGTTFSIGGAFYQAYLVKEKGWGVADVRKGTIDSIVSISLLGMVTAVILLSSWRVFFGNPEYAGFSDVGDVAKQLEPSFGFAATVVFCVGIMAGALSSFLVNALIGGTVMADSLNKGGRLKDSWPLHMTTAALLVGMIVGIAKMYNKESTVYLIVVAQASTVIGMPALAAALLYLGTRPEVRESRLVPKPIIVLAVIGFVISIVLALKTASAIYDSLKSKPEEKTAIQRPLDPVSA